MSVSFWWIDLSSGRGFSHRKKREREGRKRKIKTHLQTAPNHGVFLMKSKTNDHFSPHTCRGNSFPMFFWPSNENQILLQATNPLVVLQNRSQSRHFIRTRRNRVPKDRWNWTRPSVGTSTNTTPKGRAWGVQQEVETAAKCVKRTHDKFGVIL